MKLLYFRTEWCGVCHAKAPVVEEIARSMGVPLVVLDTDEEAGRQTAESLRIRTVPTLALVDGPRVRFRLIGRMITPQNAAHLTSLTQSPGSAS